MCKPQAKPNRERAIRQVEKLTLERAAQMAGLTNCEAERSCVRLYEKIMARKTAFYRAKTNHTAAFSYDPDERVLEFITPIIQRARRSYSRAPALIRFVEPFPAELRNAFFSV